MTKFISFILVLGLCVTTLAAEDAKKVTFQDDVQPILREHCMACHNQDDQEAGLVLDTFADAIAGGAGGEVLAAGDLAGSRLWKLVSHQEEPKMPPGDKLPEDQLEVLRKWILGGLLDGKDSKPIKSKAPAVSMVGTPAAGKPTGEAVLPTQLFNEPVVWAPHAGPVDVLATSPWAPLVAVGWQRQVSFYHTQTHQLLGILPYVEGTPRVVRFSRDGRMVLVAGGRNAAFGNAVLYDVESGAAIVSIGDELDTVLAADVSADASLVAIGGPKKKVRVYRTSDATLAYTLGKHTDWITALAFSPDGTHIATADRAGGVRLWQAAAGFERAELKGHTGAITSLAWRGDSGLLASASEDATLRLWNPEGVAVKSITAHPGGVSSVRFAHSGQIVTTGRDKKVKTWKSDGAAVADLGAMPDIALAADFTHDDLHVVASDYSGVVRVLDATKAADPVAEFAANPPTLEQVVAALAASAQQVAGQILACEEQLAGAKVSLTNGQTAHQTHQAQLAAANQKHADTVKLRDAQIAKRVTLTNIVADTQLASERAAATLLAATNKNEKEAASPSEESPSETPSEETQPGNAETTSGETAVDLAKAAQQKAEQSLEEAVAALGTITEPIAKAEQAVIAADAAVKSVVAASAKLPNLETLATEQKQLEKSLADLTNESATRQEALAKAVENRQAFIQAEENLGKLRESSQTEQETASHELAEKKAAHALLANELTTRRAALAQVKKTLQELQEQLKSLQSAEQTARDAAEQHAQTLAEIQAKSNVAQRQAQLAEARLQGFLAAQKLRAKESASR